VAFVLTPWLSFGLATPFVFAAVAWMLRSTWLVLATLVYAAALVACLASAGSAPGSSGETVYIWSLVVNIVIAGINAVLVSFMVVDELRARTPVPAPPPPATYEETVEQLEGEARAEAKRDPHLRRAFSRRARRALAHDILAEDPVLAAELGIGRPDLKRGFNDGGLIDVNGVPARVLARLPGFNAEMAARVVDARERHGDLESGAELVVYAHVPPEVVDRHIDRLIYRRQSIESSDHD
jgi:hypothetical protein